MAIYKQKVNKPVSLAGCLEVFKEAGIPESKYSQWDLFEIFEEAERIALGENIKCEEVFISLSK